MGHRGRHLFRNGYCNREGCGKLYAGQDYAIVTMGVRTQRPVSTPSAVLVAPKPPPMKCPRCSGRLLLVRDQLGRSEQDELECVNCGYAGGPRPGVVFEIEEPDTRQRRRGPASHGMKL